MVQAKEVAMHPEHCNASTTGEEPRVNGDGPKVLHSLQIERSAENGVHTSHLPL
eukprot:m.602197 g.602197  ORF g.602197 m.602197 type:complete len:54 (+) comp22443_c0_seq9:1322-1483(+)